MFGEQNMSVLYDSATTWLDRAAAIDPSGPVLAMRARTKFSKAIWQKLNPPGTTPADPLVNDAGAAEDATAALPKMAGDFFYSIETTNQNVGDGSGGGFGFEFNNRGELAVSPDLASLDPDDFHLVAVTAKDPVTGTLDATATKMIAIVAQAEDGNNPPMVQVSKQRCTSSSRRSRWQAGITRVSTRTSTRFARWTGWRHIRARDPRDSSYCSTSGGSI